MRRILLFAALAALPQIALAGPGPVVQVPIVRGTATTSLPGTCVDGQARYDSTANAWKYCSANTWTTTPPPAHAASHASAGSDPVTLAESQVTNLTTDLASKVPTTRQVIAGTGLSGGGALSANVTVSLPAVGTAGTYGDSTHYPVVTTDAQGRVSSVSTQAVTSGGPARPALVGNETLVWRCNDATSPLLNSGSAVSADLTVFGSPFGYQMPGTFGSGVASVLTGSSQAGWAGASGVHVSSPFTASAWFIPTAIPGSFGMIVEKPDPAYINTEFQIFVDSSSKVNARIDNGAIQTITSTHQVVLNAPVFAAATYDGATFKLYVNGVLSASAAVAGALTTFVSSWTIGARNTASALAFEGTIYEVRVNPTALSAATIAAQYRSGMGYVP